MDDPERRALVATKVRDERWSPEQVEGRIRAERPDHLPRDSLGEVGLRAAGASQDEPPPAPPGQAQASQGLRGAQGQDSDHRRIAITHELSERPPEASDRSRAGDWEGDTVAGRQGGPCLVTLVDRMTGYLAGGLAPRKAAAEVTAVIESSLSGGALETLTLDRGKEFAKAAQIQDGLGMPVYFCLPHHPWEKGTNENTNGLLRDFFPKGASLDGTTGEEVEAAYATLNRRPRKRLGWKCPEEVFNSRALHLL